VNLRIPPLEQWPAGMSTTYATYLANLFARWDARRIEEQMGAPAPASALSAAQPVVDLMGRRSVR